MANRGDYSEVSWGSLRPILQDMADRLARIEQFLAASGLQVPPSISSTSLPADASGFYDAVPNTFDPAPADSPGRMAAAARGIEVGAIPSQGSQIPDYIVQLATSGKTIQAIKEFRSFSGMGLKESKAIIEQVAIRGY
jgi:ribosomal protein L7/L12